MTSGRTTCGDKGSVNRWGNPCGSTIISRDTGLCRSHDTGQVNQVHQARIRGGRKSRSNRLSRRIQRLVQLLFGDASLAPTLDKIEPRPFNDDNPVHMLKMNGMYAVLDGHGPDGLSCTLVQPVIQGTSEHTVMTGEIHIGGHYRCQDQSMFAKAMRLLRIIETWKGGETVYVHMDTGSIIPQSEIAKIVKLVRER